jgi:uncharacterized protein (DUF952 family)
MAAVQSLVLLSLAGIIQLTANIVFKILSDRDWAEAQMSGAYSGSNDDHRDGFIHLSTASQLPGTLEKYFSGKHDLLLVAFDSVSLAPHLKWEASRGGDLFPHHYGPLQVTLALWQKKLPAETVGMPDLEKPERDKPNLDKEDL